MMTGTVPAEPSVTANARPKTGRRAMTTPYRIAVIPGDGIGTEVVPEGLRVLNTVGRAFDIDLAFEHFDYACADYYTAHEKMLPDNWFDELAQFDAIFFGAVGWPDVVPEPEHISLWGSLIQFRRHFDQYVSLRPVKLMPGVRCPLAPGAHPAMSTSWSCARTPKESIPVSVARFSTAPSARRSSRRPS